MNIFQRFRGSILPPLGRWSRTDEIKNNIKVDWSNTDHCGTCLYKRPDKAREFLPVLTKVVKDRYLTIYKKSESM